MTHIQSRTLIQVVWALVFKTSLQSWEPLYRCWGVTGSFWAVEKPDRTDILGSWCPGVGGLEGGHQLYSREDALKVCTEVCIWFNPKLCCRTRFFEFVPIMSLRGDPTLYFWTASQTFTVQKTRRMTSKPYKRSFLYSATPSDASGRTTWPMSSSIDRAISLFLPNSLETWVHKKKIPSPVNQT